MLQEKQNEYRSIRFPASFVADIEKDANIGMRSIPKQIEYWVRIARDARAERVVRAARANPDLPVEFIESLLDAMNEPSEPFEFRYDNENRI